MLCVMYSGLPQSSLIRFFVVGVVVSRNIFGMECGFDVNELLDNDSVSLIEQWMFDFLLR